LSYRFKKEVVFSAGKIERFWDFGFLIWENAEVPLLAPDNLYQTEFLLLRLFFISRRFRRWR
jgi:hypothetical protein